MSEKQVYKLQTDEYFKQLIPPLTQNERQLLEENIEKDGCREPLCVWGEIIVDGHNRYEICTKLRIPFHVQQVDFNNREEVIAWICINQLGRRNISDETRRYLIGKRYEAEKILGTRNPSGRNQHPEKEVNGRLGHKPQTQEYQRITAAKLGEEYNINERTVRQYGNYSRAMDVLAEKEPELISEVLSGKVKISYNTISKLTNLPVQKTKNVKNKSGNKNSNSNVKKALITKSEKITIKDMPIYDPDSEISGLTLTIPSWVSSINRTLSVADFNKISNKAKIKLQSELNNLEYTVDAMLLALEE